MRERFFELLESMPLIAVLRGLEPQAAVPIGAALIDAGLVALEVPMNSPQPTESIRSLQDAFGRQILIGAGTVMCEDHVDRVAGAGLNEGGAMEMTEGEVCPNETKSTPIAPLQAARPSNSVLCVQESRSWFPDPACSTIIRPSLRSHWGMSAKIRYAR